MLNFDVDFRHNIAATLSEASALAGRTEDSRSPTVSPCDRPPIRLQRENVMTRHWPIRCRPFGWAAASASRWTTTAPVGGSKRKRGLRGQDSEIAAIKAEIQVLKDGCRIRLMRCRTSRISSPTCGSRRGSSTGIWRTFTSGRRAATCAGPCGSFPNARTTPDTRSTWFQSCKSVENGALKQLEAVDQSKE